MGSRINHMIASLAAGAGAAIVAGTAGAQCTIYFDGGNRKVDLTVLLTDENEDPNNWKDVFNRTSKLLWDATEGNLQLGKVRFIGSCQAATGLADIWVDDTNDRAAWAHSDGCGRDGWIVRIAEGVNAPLGEVTIVHELGHYIFNLGDEYGGLPRETGVLSWFWDQYEEPQLPGNYMWANYVDVWNPNQPSVIPQGEVIRFADTQQQNNRVFYGSFVTGGTGSIMDASQVWDSGRTEFSHPSQTSIAPNPFPITADINAYRNGVLIIDNEEYELVTHQMYRNDDEACWETIADSLGISMPSTISDSPPGGDQAVEYEFVGNTPRYMLCIDRSGSMSGDRIALARQGASLFVDRAQLPITVPIGPETFNISADEIGVVSFSSSTSTNASLTSVDTPAVKTTLKNAISGITDGGSTNIGGGLQTSLAQFTGQMDMGCVESIILLSDGAHNTGTNPSSVIPALVNRGVIVHSIALGSGADIGTLSSVSSATGGRVFSATSPGQLPRIFDTILRTLRREDTILSKTVDLARLSDPVTYIIDDSVGQFTITVLGNTTDTFITSPSGAVSGSATQQPNVTYDVAIGSEIFTVTEPESGEWTLRVDGTGSAEVIVSANIKNYDGFSVETNVPSRLDFNAYPDARLLITAAIKEEKGPVVGADVYVTVTRPDGVVVTKTLYDDGDHGTGSGDSGWRDGTYSWDFRDFAGPGIYTFELTADTRNGDAMIPSQIHGDNSQFPATATVRVSTTTTVIEGPPPQDVDGDFDSDDDVDLVDLSTFLNAVGRSEGDPFFLYEADYNGDGYIGLDDYRVWDGHYAAFLVQPPTPSQPVNIELGACFASGDCSQTTLGECTAMGGAWEASTECGAPPYDTPCSTADTALPFGTLDLADLTAFVEAFIDNSPTADLAEPTGLLDLADITTFVSEFIVGCP